MGNRGMNGKFKRLAGMLHAAQNMVLPALLVAGLCLGMTGKTAPAANAAALRQVGCTLSIMGGEVAVMAPGEDWEAGTDGDTLYTGTLIKTASVTTAMLTFFDGSVLQLDPKPNWKLLSLTRRMKAAPLSN